MPTEISPGRALLILIDKYQNDSVLQKELKRLYLVGARSKKDHELFLSLLKDPVLKDFVINYSRMAIDSDPTRRYFETHLSIESLKSSLSEISLDDLNQHYQKLLSGFSKEQKLVIEYLFDKNTTPEDIEKKPEFKSSVLLFKEYPDAIKRLHDRTSLVKDLSEDDIKKMELIIKSAFLGVYATMTAINLPLDIYDTNPYYIDKGKAMKPEQASVRSQAMGLMKGEMPLARDDEALSERAFEFLKPSDQATFDRIQLSSWLEKNFEQMFHPYSNSISGTMLCQIRNLAKFKNENRLQFDDAEKMALYLKCFTSAMLFNSGGHTLNEFLTPLELQEVQLEFIGVNGFNSLGFEKIFFDNNDKALDEAFKKSIEYNNQIMKMENLNDSIKKKEIESLKMKIFDFQTHHSGDFNPLESIEKILSKIITTMEPLPRNQEIVRIAFFEAYLEALERGNNKPDPIEILREHYGFNSKIADFKKQIDEIFKHCKTPETQERIGFLFSKLSFNPNLPVEFFSAINWNEIASHESMIDILRTLIEVQKQFPHYNNESDIVYAINNRAISQLDVNSPDYNNIMNAAHSQMSGLNFDAWHQIIQKKLEKISQYIPNEFIKHTQDLNVLATEMSINDPYQLDPLAYFSSHFDFKKILPHISDPKVICQLELDTATDLTRELLRIFNENPSLIAHQDIEIIERLCKEYRYLNNECKGILATNYLQKNQVFTDLYVKLSELKETNGNIAALNSKTNNMEYFYYEKQNDGYIKLMTFCEGMNHILFNKAGHILDQSNIPLTTFAAARSPQRIMFWNDRGNCFLEGIVQKQTLPPIPKTPSPPIPKTPPPPIPKTPPPPPPKTPPPPIPKTPSPLSAAAPAEGDKKRPTAVIFNSAQSAPQSKPEEPAKPYDAQQKPKKEPGK